LFYPDAGLLPDGGHPAILNDMTISKTFLQLLFIARLVTQPSLFADKLFYVK